VPTPKWRVRLAVPVESWLPPQGLALTVGQHWVLPQGLALAGVLHLVLLPMPKQSPAPPRLAQTGIYLYEEDRTSVEEADDSGVLGGSRLRFRRCLRRCLRHGLVR
jgi:hypothetical protein